MLHLNTIHPKLALLVLRFNSQFIIWEYEEKMQKVCMWSCIHFSDSCYHVTTNGCTVHFSPPLNTYTHTHTLTRSPEHNHTLFLNLYMHICWILTTRLTLSLLCTLIWTSLLLLPFFMPFWSQWCTFTSIWSSSLSLPYCPFAKHVYCDSSQSSMG